MTSIVGCSAQKVSNSKAAYKDGTYKAEGDKWDLGSEDATFTVKYGKIQEIVLGRIDKQGKEVDYKSYYESGGPDLSKAILNKQTSEVNTFASASMSSGNWKTAVKEPG